MANNNKNKMAVRKVSAYLNEFLAKVMQDEEIPTSLVSLVITSSANILKEVKEKED